ncbi:uncharacterized protein LOC129945521 [Eupeodes corollae]|uniref:uncharacterized protein LOC129945521 n=1 Tax=Eupeodes corollae TaxID=290404 RepID=UPI002493783F|nr:uncharacterized protein LOC129945521 [Eupeodes corollae]
MLSSEDYRECLVKNLITIRDSIKVHDQLVESEKEIQRGVLDRLWVLSQRYSIISKGAPTKLNFPAVHPPEGEIKAEFLAKFCSLESSNLKLTTSLSNVKNTFSALEKFLDQMEVEHLSVLDQATSLQLPFSSCLEMLADLIKYFTKLQSQMNCFALLLRPDSVSSVELYKKFLKPNQDFSEHLSKSLAMLHILKKTKS